MKCACVCIRKLRTQVAAKDAACSSFESTHLFGGRKCIQFISKSICNALNDELTYEKRRQGTQKPFNFHVSVVVRRLSHLNIVMAGIAKSVVVDVFMAFNSGSSPSTIRLSVCVIFLSIFDRIFCVCVNFDPPLVLRTHKLILILLRLQLHAVVHPLM